MNFVKITMRKMIFSKKNLLFFIIFLSGLNCYSLTYTYKSKVTGDWSLSSTWYVSSDGGSTWSNAISAPNSSNASIVIQNGHTVTISSSGLSVDELTIESGGVLILSATKSFTVNNGVGANDVVINGTFTNAGTVTTTGTLIFGSTGVYNHNQDGGTIPAATWSVNSICNITGVTSTLCAGITQTFHHLNWNNANQNIDLFFESTTPTVNGVLKILNTGSKSLGLARTSTGRTWATVDSLEIAGGDFSLAGRITSGWSGISSSQTYSMSISYLKVSDGLFSVANDYSPNLFLNISNNCEVSGGSLVLANDDNNNNNTFAKITIGGNLLVNGGDLELTNTNSSGSIGQIFLSGDFTLSLGTVKCSQSGSGSGSSGWWGWNGRSGFYFSGNGSQTFTYSGGTMSASPNEAGSRFYYKTSSGPTGLFEVYNGTTSQQTINGSSVNNGSSSLPTGYAAWPTSGNLLIDVTINNNVGVVLMTDKKVNGVLSFTKGKLTLGSNLLTIGGTVTGMSATKSFVGSSSSEISIAGTGNVGSVFFDQTTLETTNLLKSLIMNTTDVGSLTLGNNLTVRSTLTLTKGLILTSANTLSVGTTSVTGTISGGSSDSYIVAYDNNGTIGSLKRYVRAVGTFAFPIGDLSNYTPLTTTLATATLSNATLTAYTKAAKIPGLSSSITNYLNRYWELTPSGMTGSISYSVTYNYNQADIVGSESNLFPIKKSGSIWNRPSGTSFLNGVLMGAGSNDATTNTLSWGSLTTFSSFGAVGNQSVVLPNELVSFKAKAQKGDVKLDWQTASEIDNAYFIVERSFDGIHFAPLTRVEGAGNSSHIINYSIDDFDYVNGINYYRLIQTDYNGKETISRIESVDMSNKQFYFVKTINSLGQEVDEMEKGIVFDIYSDGTSVKRIQF